MAKRRVKRTTKQSVPSPSRNIDDPEVPVEKEENEVRDHEVARRSAAIRASRDVEIDNLLTGLRLLRSYFSEERMQTPVLKFFEENLPNLSVVKNGKDGQLEVRWKDKNGNLSMNLADGSNMHASLLHGMSSFTGLEFSRQAVNASVLAADNLQIGDFVLEQPSESQMLGLQGTLQTPGMSSQRLSIGLTPNTKRLPKHGEMLLSVHGSPLGVYNTLDNMEAIHESEEG